MKAFAFTLGTLILSCTSALFLTQCGRVLAEGENGVDASPAQCPISADTTSCNLPSETPCDFASPADCRGLERWICEDGQWHGEGNRVGSPGGAIPCPPDDDAGDGGE